MTFLCRVGLHDWKNGEVYSQPVDFYINGKLDKNSKLFYQLRVCKLCGKAKLKKIGAINK